MTDSYQGKGAGGFQPRADGKPHARGGTKKPELRPGQAEAPRAERRAVARAIYEGQPGATCEFAAEQVGVPVGTVRRWKVIDQWKPAVRRLPDLSARAGALADSFKVKMSELGKPLDDDVAAAEVAKEMGADIAIDVRAAVLDRHRKEWSAPRKIAYESIAQAQKGDVAGGFERAKLAKITSETLTLIQAGECRAFGINHDARAADSRTIVLVDRDGAAPGEPDPAPSAISPTPGTSTDGEF